MSYPTSPAVRKARHQQKSRQQAPRTVRFGTFTPDAPLVVKIATGSFDRETFSKAPPKHAPRFTEQYLTKPIRRKA